MARRSESSRIVATCLKQPNLLADYTEYVNTLVKCTPKCNPPTRILHVFQEKNPSGVGAKYPRGKLLNALRFCACGLPIFKETEMLYSWGFLQDTEMVIGSKGDLRFKNRDISCDIGQPKEEMETLIV